MCFFPRGIVSQLYFFSAITFPTKFKKKHFPCFNCSNENGTQFDFLPPNFMPSSKKSLFFQFFSPFVCEKWKHFLDQSGTEWIQKSFFFLSLQKVGVFLWQISNSAFVVVSFSLTNFARIRKSASLNCTVFHKAKNSINIIPGSPFYWKEIHGSPKTPFIVIYILKI